MLGLFLNLLDYKTLPVKHWYEVEQSPIVDEGDYQLAIIIDRNIVTFPLNLTGDYRGFIKNVDKAYIKITGCKPWKDGDKRPYWMFVDNKHRVITYRTTGRCYRQSIIGLINALSLNISGKVYQKNKRAINRLIRYAKYAKQVGVDYDTRMEFLDILKYTEIHFYHNHKYVDTLAIKYDGVNSNIPLILRILVLRGAYKGKIKWRNNSPVFYMDAKYYREIYEYCQTHDKCEFTDVQLKPINPKPVKGYHVDFLLA